MGLKLFFHACMLLRVQASSLGIKLNRCAAFSLAFSSLLLHRVRLVVGLALQSEPLISNRRVAERNWTAKPPRFPTFEQLHERLFGVSPWHNGNQSHVVEGFSNPYKLQPDYSFPYSNVVPWLFQQLITGCTSETLCSVNFIVEVGSLHGASALTMSSVLDNVGLFDVPVLCIDPFTGDVNMWASYRRDPGVRRWVNIQDGRMLAYDQFMVNVKASFSDISNRHIIPFKATSTVGARWLQMTKYTPDLVFIDSAHEEHETFVEIALYFRVLTPGGMIFGDDYNWPMVRRDVNRFVEEHNFKNHRRKACTIEATTPEADSASILWMIRKSRAT